MQTGLRRQGREFAIKILYCFSQAETDMETVLELFWNNFRFGNDVLGETLEDEDVAVAVEARKFAEVLARGYYQNREQIDGMIKEFSTNWSLERMAKVDLAILRMSSYELLYLSDIPTSVVINEAVEIGKRYGTSDTPSFVNGLLDKISRTYRTAAT